MAVGGGKFPTREGRLSEREAERGPLSQNLFGYLLKQPNQRVHIAAPHQVIGDTLEQVRGGGIIRNGEEMMGGLSHLSIAFQPARRPSMQLRRKVWRLLAQMVAQEVGKEMVVAIPAPFIVERDDEQIGPREPLEHGPAIVRARSVRRREARTCGRATMCAAGRRARRRAGPRAPHRPDTA